MSSQPPHQNHLRNLSKLQTQVFNTQESNSVSPTEVGSGFTYPRTQKRKRKQTQKRRQTQTNVGEVLATLREPPPLLPLPALAAMLRLYPCSSWPEDECHLFEPSILLAPGICSSRNHNLHFLGGTRKLTTEHHTQGGGKTKRKNKGDQLVMNKQVHQRKV